jgi:hypothetical protein
MQGKFGKPPRGGGSAERCIRYLLGEEATRKVEHVRMEIEPLH